MIFVVDDDDSHAAVVTAVAVDGNKLSANSCWLLPLLASGVPVHQLLFIFREQESNGILWLSTSQLKLRLICCVSFEGDGEPKPMTSPLPSPKKI